jgi:hypothetical protein
MSDHLTDETRKVLSQSIAHRLLWFQQERWFDYPAADEVLQLMTVLANKPKKDRMPGALVTAESNAGKTSLAMRFLGMHPSYCDEKEQRRRVPVIRLEMPHNPNCSAVAEGLIEQLDLPYRPRDLPHFKSRLLVRSFKQIGLRLLVIDEFQRILGARKDTQIIVLDFLRELANLVPVPLVVFSTPRGTGALASNDEMITRLRPLILPVWPADRMFQSLLMRFESVIPLKERSHLASETMATLIYDASGGLLGEVADLLEMALVKCLNSKREKIDEALIHSLNWVRPKDRKLRVTKMLE